MRITGDWLTHPGTVAVMAMLDKAGHQAFFVGGCVRNALLETPVADIDIATDAPPGQVMALAQAAGLNAVPTGIDHGTVTVIAGERAHEVTTFRRDVATDGRRAVVAFSTHIEDDARRRDFTMNALYAGADGQVTDPLGGLPDLMARRVRFIEDADARLREDYLRLLRFFRFHAWYGDPAQGPDPEGLAACAAHVDGLSHLSRERVGAEMWKLLAAVDPAPAVASLAAIGGLARVLPGADAVALPVLVSFEAAFGLAPEPGRRLALLGAARPDLALRLPNVQARRIAALSGAARNGAGPAELGYRMGPDQATDAALIRAALLGMHPPAGWQAAIARGAAARFPVRAADLPGLQGPDIGAELRRLEAAWIASDFSMTKDKLLRGPSPSA